MRFKHKEWSKGLKILSSTIGTKMTDGGGAPSGIYY